MLSHHGCPMGHRIMTWFVCHRLFPEPALSFITVQAFRKLLLFARNVGTSWQHKQDFFVLSFPRTWLFAQGCAMRRRPSLCSSRRLKKRGECSQFLQFFSCALWPSLWTGVRLPLPSSKITFSWAPGFLAHLYCSPLKPTVGRKSTDRQPTVDQWSVDRW